MKVLFFILLAVVSSCVANIAQACIGVNHKDYELDESEIGVDTEPPEKLEIVGFEINRSGKTPPFATSSCDDGAAAIMVEFSPLSDDRTPSDKLGVKVLFVNKEPPKSFQSWSGRIVYADRHIVMQYQLDEESEPFDFDIELAAVDKAGNVGEADVTTIQEVNCGCRSFQSPTTIVFLPLVLFLGRFFQRRNY